MGRERARPPLCASASSYCEQRQQLAANRGERNAIPFELSIPGPWLAGAPPAPKNLAPNCCRAPTSPAPVAARLCCGALAGGRAPALARGPPGPLAAGAALVRAYRLAGGLCR